MRCRRRRRLRRRRKSSFFLVLGRLVIIILFSRLAIEKVETTPKSIDGQGHFIK